MRLLTAHKILIGSAIVFFAFFTLWEVREVWAARGGSMLTALLSAAGTVGLVAYYRRRFR
jgi:hypothetical protein